MPSRAATSRTDIPHAVRVRELGRVAVRRTGRDEHPLPLIARLSGAFLHATIVWAWSAALKLDW
jgi:hypothetical protein